MFLQIFHSSAATGAAHQNICRKLIHNDMKVQRTEISEDNRK